MFWAMGMVWRRSNSAALAAQYAEACGEAASAFLLAMKITEPPTLVESPLQSLLTSATAP